MDETTITLIAAIAATLISLGALVHLVGMVQCWPRAPGAVTGNIAE
jgi:hypothetical protein